MGKKPSESSQGIQRTLGIIPVFSVAVALGTGGSAAAANAGSQLLCFDGTTDTANHETGTAVYGGICTRTSNGATLNNLVPGPDGQYSGSTTRPRA